MATLLTSKQPAKESTTLEVRTNKLRQPPRRPPLLRRSLKWRLLLLVLGSLAILFLLHVIVTYAQSPVSQISNCAELMSMADYPQAVNLQPGQEMAAVQMVNDLDGGAPAALVQVLSHTPQNTLDIYVFGCSIQQNQFHLTRLFTQRGLIQGGVELTPQHTLLTKMMDTRIAADVVPFLQPLQQNVYHEYAWLHGGFVQVPFAGFYPVSSRAEAEALQQNANNGESLPWNDPISTALQMSKDLLQWPDDPQAQLLSQMGDTARVGLTRQSPHTVLVVTLKQLIQTNGSGLWFVTDARTRGMLLTSPGSLDQPWQPSVSSPIHFSGANALIDGHTTATLFDHTMTPVSQATNVPLTVHRDSSYSGTLAYANLAPGQQGVLLIQSMPQTQNLGKESGQMLLTGVILN